MVGGQVMGIRFVSLDEGHHAWQIGVRQLPIRIGSSPGADVRLDDETVSDLHCEIDAVNGVLWVRDLGSREGTFVNGFHVAQSHVPPGDRLTVGDDESPRALPAARHPARWKTVGVTGHPGATSRNLFDGGEGR